MFLKWLSLFVKLRQGHPIMLVLKYGKTKRMIKNPTFGHWDVYYMK